MIFLSGLLIVISAYLFLSSIVQTKKEPIVIYMMLIAYAQTVLSFEVLSLFSMISRNNFLISNVIILIISIYIFKKCRKGIYIPELCIKKILTEIKKDKALIFLSVSFVLFIIFQLINIINYPITFGDALVYYLPRCTSWIQNGNLNHYITPDTRELIMPINMDLLYTWKLLFTKSEAGVGIYSFIGYIGCIYVIFRLLRELKYTIRRSIWSIIAVSTFALVIMEMVNPCSDLFIGALILTSIYLYIRYIKEEDKVSIYFSSLAYALAIGTKTTAIIAIPSVFIIFCVITKIYKREWKNLLRFMGLFILNFIIFSSYNYILNFIQFLNPISCPEQILLNQFQGGIKGYITNLIKYIFAIFDMSGMPEFININGLIEYWQSLVLNLFSTNIKAGTSKYFPYYFVFNNKMIITHSALGIMGLIVFLPSLIYSLKRMIKNKNNKSALIMGVLAFSFIFNIVLFSGIMIFTSYNMRYILTFIVIASPIVAYSYPKKKLCKIFLCIIMFNYLIGCTYKNSVSYTDTEENSIYKYFSEIGHSKIGIMINQSTSPVYYIEKLKLKGIHTDKILAENIEDYDLSKYDYIITNTSKVVSSNVVKFKEKIKYPDIYISKCIYKDKFQNTIYTEGNNPAIVECEIPFEYIEEKHFIREKKYKGKDYVILKNMKNSYI